MNDNLEKFITENRNEFDSYEPSDLLWNHIKQKTCSSKQSFKRYFILKIAAVLIMFLTCLFFIYLYYKNNNTNKNIAASQGVYDPELVETEIYYMTQVNKKVNELNGYITQHPEIAKEIMHDLSELDTLSNELKKEISQDINREQIINALIQSYRIKIELLEDMLNQMKKYTNEEKKSYEL